MHVSQNRSSAGRFVSSTSLCKVFIKLAVVGRALKSRFECRLACDCGSGPVNELPEPISAVRIDRQEIMLLEKRSYAFDV